MHKTMIKPLNIIKSNKDRNEVITPAQKTSTVTDRRKRISDCVKASLNSHHEHDCQYLDVTTTYYFATSYETICYR